MHIYEVLRKDHRSIEILLNKLSSLPAKQITSARIILKQIRLEYFLHTRAEEALLYNSIRAVSRFEFLVWQGAEEHQAIENLMRILKAAIAIDPAWPRLARQLQDLITSHIAEEEAEIIPAAGNLFTQTECEVMGDAYVGLKVALDEDGCSPRDLDSLATLLPTHLATPLRSFVVRQS